MPRVSAAPSVVEYCQRNGVDPNSLQMEVIVQRLIQPELAGVAFTVNPMTEPMKCSLKRVRDWQMNCWLAE